VALFFDFVFFPDMVARPHNHSSPDSDPPLTPAHGSVIPTPPRETRLLINTFIFWGAFGPNHPEIETQSHKRITGGLKEDKVTNLLRRMVWGGSGVGPGGLGQVSARLEQVGSKVDFHSKIARKSLENRSKTICVAAYVKSTVIAHGIYFSLTSQNSCISRN
jgi:hypothetical protein